MRLKLMSYLRFVEMDYIIDENDAIIGFGYSDLRKNEIYVLIYTMWIRLFCTGVIPLTLMVFFNAAIIFHYCQNRYLYLVKIILIAIPS